MPPTLASACSVRPLRRRACCRAQFSRCVALRCAPLAAPRLPACRLRARARLPLRVAAAEAQGAGEPPPPLSEPPPPPPPPQTPGLMDANVSYSLGCIWLVFLTDLSGIGPVVLSSDNVPLSLALLQWGAFVAPTVASTVSAGYDLRRTFSLRGCSATQLGAATAGGAALWVLLAAATALRGGVAPDGAEASYRIVEGAATLWGAPADAAGWASLLGLGALAPAAGEELLFRGYLLTALRSRLGRYDAAALCAALFACFHLSFTQFFPTAVLGLAAGAAAVSSESIVPAVALHAAHNAAALAWGAAVCEGALPPGPPPMWAVVAAAAVAAAAATVGAREADGGEGAQD